jgi:Ricin-type beta-trefoil lectin domain/Beta-1,3-glucanase
MKLLLSLRPPHLSHAVPRAAAEGAAAALPRRSGRELVATLGAGMITVALASVGTTVTSAEPAAADVTATGPITGYQGLCLDDRSASTANYNPIQVYTCNGTAAQSWTVDSTTNTLMVLGMCLDVKGGGTANNTTVDLYTCNSTGAQVWVPQSNGELVNPQSGKCLDDTGYGGSGTQVQIYACADNAAQQWKLPSSSGGGGGTGFGGFPAAFWGNTSSIPSASGAIEFDFINATNGQYPDSEVYWSVNGVTESIAQSPYYTMSSCSACRINFYLGAPNSSYTDFIELNSSGTTINADTSRVDAFGLPLAVHLHNSNNTDVVVGEDDQVFAESRTALFSQFQSFVPAQFQQLATVNAPYTIPAPGHVAAFQPGGADASYMTSYAASVGASETTQQVFQCNSGGSPDLSQDPSLCAGLNRCVAQFSATVQDTPADFYQNAPCNYYSAFWHSVAVNGLQYGFPYDDYNSQSSDFNTTNAQYVQVAIGW